MILCWTTQLLSSLRAGIERRSYGKARLSYQTKEIDDEPRPSDTPCVSNARNPAYWLLKLKFIEPMECLPVAKLSDEV